MSGDTTERDVELALARARSATPVLRASTPSERCAWLEALAVALASHIDDLVAVAGRETHLGEARLRGEVARTINQLRLFVDVVRDGGYVEAILDSADTTAQPPRADIRRMLRPLGPVAVFGASNFPFAFSVLGGDTASALAAGCPVIVKAHPGHPETSELTAAIARRALRGAGAPLGTFALVHGMDAGIALVGAGDITAVGFTGSVRGGRALFDLACARPDPIPFYGELGSLNPVVVTRQAIDERAAEIVSGFVHSFTNDGGQLCTKPGIVLVPRGTKFETALREIVGGLPTTTLLTAGITEAFRVGCERLAAVPTARVLAGTRSRDDGAVSPLVIGVDVAALVEHGRTLLEECFGPFALVAFYDDDAELGTALAAVPPSLTASIHHGSDDQIDAIAAFASTIAGRVIFNGWPTGVALGWAQHHGGGWPATTASVHTSVGATSIRRWLTPVAYQNAPEEALPEALRQENPLGIVRRIDGVLTV